MKPETSETVTKVASAAATALATHTNPYGFIPLLLPLAVAAGVSGLVVLSKSEKPSTLGSLFSIPTFLGAGAGYAVGAATKVDDKTLLRHWHGCRMGGPAVPHRPERDGGGGGGGSGSGGEACVFVALSFDVVLSP
jgi:hypothetical protein